jgi:hypothetical protein
MWVFSIDVGFFEVPILIGHAWLKVLVLVWSKLTLN